MGIAYSNPREVHTPEYCAWGNLIARCENERRPDFKDYGGRGVSVCREWRENYIAFLSYVGRRPGKAYSIDRYPDQNGNYEPGNVRWATKREQANNRRSACRISAFGMSLTAPEWSELKGIRSRTIKSRLRLGMSPEDALTRPLQTTADRRNLVSKLARVRWDKEKERCQT